MFISVDIRHLQNHKMYLEEEIRLLNNAADCLNEIYNILKADEKKQDAISLISAQLDYISKHISWIKNRISFIDSMIEIAASSSSFWEML